MAEAMAKADEEKKRMTVQLDEVNAERDEQGSIISNLEQELSERNVKINHYKQQADDFDM